MPRSRRLMTTVIPLFGLSLALALAAVAGCGAAGDDAPAPTAAAPPGEIATTESALAIGGGGTPGIKGCSTNCYDSFVKCAQAGADWNVCQATYNICVILCGISGAPVANGGLIATVGDAPPRAVGSATSAPAAH